MRGNLEIEDDGLLPPQDGGGIGKQRVDDSHIPGVDLRAPHDLVLVDVQDNSASGAIHRDPASRPRRRRRRPPVSTHRVDDVSGRR